MQNLRSWEISLLYAVFGPNGSACLNVQAEILDVMNSLTLRGHFLPNGGRSQASSSYNSSHMKIFYILYFPFLGQIGQPLPKQTLGALI